MERVILALVLVVIIAVCLYYCSEEIQAIGGYGYGYMAT